MLRENKALWSRVPHFYYNYYVFQYSTSFVASSALVSKILEEGESAREKYLNFLKSGRSKYPMETLLEAGVDMSSADPVKRTIKLMDKLMDQVEELLG
jgi:oligoendopeptidase F